MEDGFRVRVDKVFGSLATSSGSSSSAPLNALWCLTDDEIERTEWNRDKDGPKPEKKPKLDLFCSNSFLENVTEGNKPADFRSQMEEDLDDLDDGDGDEGGEEEERRSHASSSKSEKPDDYNEEEWEIKSSIGLDCTLDYEEEEDEYDKVAVGKEQSGDRLYMKDVSDYETDADDWQEIPSSFEDVTRDPRANHIAAKIRLKEDAEAAKKMDYLQVSEKIDSLQVSENNDSLGVSEKNDPLHFSENNDLRRRIGANAQADSSEDGKLRSIMKRKDLKEDFKLQKRVRFSSECKKDCDEGVEGEKDSAIETCSSEGEDGSDNNYMLPPDYPSGIPDYMRNPSKYTRYTLDSGPVDEESNRQAYMDFIEMMKSRRKIEESPQEDVLAELPKSVAFIPKRKQGDAIMVENETEPTENQNNSGNGLVWRRGGAAAVIAAVGIRDDEVCPMEEDELEMDNSVRRGSHRSGRRYRTKTNEDPED